MGIFKKSYVKHVRRHNAHDDDVDALLLNA